MQSKLKILPVILTLFFTLKAGPPDTLWTKTYGGTNYDVGYSVQQTNDGGFIIVGLTQSFGAGWTDVYLIRIDSNGDTLWTKTYGDDSAEVGLSVLQTNEGGYIIAGNTDSYGAGHNDVLIIRTDANGDTLWTKTYGKGYYIDYGYSIQQTIDGGFIVTGRTDSLISSSPPLVKSDPFLLRTDSNGEELWLKTYSGRSSVGKSVQQTSDGGFIIAGSRGDPNFSVVSIIRTDSMGDTLWTKIYCDGVPDYPDVANSVQQTSDGGFIIAGTTRSAGAGWDDVYLLRTDSKGDSLWTKTYGGESFDYGNSVQKTNDGGFVIAGYTHSFGTGGRDVYIIRTDLNGDTLWTKTCGGDSSDYGNSVIQTNDGGFIVAGETDSYGSGSSDVYLIRLDKETVGIQDDNPNFSLKPNNFLVSSSLGNISIRYTLPFSTRIKLEAFDIQGRLVEKIQDRFMHKGSYSVKWESKRFGAGVYFVRLRIPGSSSFVPPSWTSADMEVSRKVTVVK